MTFDSRWNEIQKRHNRMRKAILWGIGIIFSIIVAIWISLGIGLYKIADTVDFSHGLKGVVEQVWYGSDYK